MEFPSTPMTAVKIRVVILGPLVTLMAAFARAGKIGAATLHQQKFVAFCCCG